MKFIKVMIRRLLPIVVICISIIACGSRENGKVKRDGREEAGRVEEATESKITALTRSSFIKNIADFENNPEEWVFLGKRPVILDFYADWCVYCRQLAPILEELAEEYEGKIDIYKINTDREQEIAAIFGVVSLPTLFFIPMEGVPQYAKGALPKEELKRIIESILL